MEKRQGGKIFGWPVGPMGKELAVIGGGEVKDRGSDKLGG
jgi:hypothetical protein